MDHEAAAASSAPEELHGSFLQFLAHIDVAGRPIMHVHGQTPGHEGWVPESVVFASLAGILLLVFMRVATRRMTLIPRGAQSFFEYTVVGLNGFFAEIVGPRGQRYLPMIGILFLYIFVMNMMGLVPGMKAATAELNTTVALALAVFVMVVYAGIRETGLFHFLLHFAGPVATAKPKWYMWPVFIPIGLFFAVLELIGFLARHFALAVRLAGNMFGKETAIAVLTGMSIPLLTMFHAGKFRFGPPIPFQFPMMLLGVLLGAIQALVFSLLAAVFVSLVTASDEAHH